LRFQFIAAEKARFPVAVLCRVLKVRPSGFYAWSKRPVSRRKADDEKLKVFIRASHKKSRMTYGSPRVHLDLRQGGLRVGRKRVARLMQDEGLCGNPPRKFKRTTDSAHDKPIAPNLLQREFDGATAPNQAWVGDITYIWTAAGWLYLAVIIDLFSRRVVGFAIDDHMRTELVTEALKSALETRDISKGLITHTDRGSKYTSDEHVRIASDAGITLSMSRKGDCWDNAVAESFFATLKKDLIHRQPWISKRQAIIAVADYILSFYNRQRRHSANGGISPADYDVLTMIQKAA